LEAKIDDLEAKLAGSVPKKEADTLRARLRELESILAGSISRREAEAELETASSKLRGEIKQLKEKLAASLPKVEANAAKAELIDKVSKLEAKLAESIPRGEAQRLRAEIEELEKKLATSKSEGESLRAKVAQFQDTLTMSVPKADSEAKVNELEAKLSVERREIEVARKTIRDLQEQLSQSSARIDELQGKLSDSIPRTEVETTKRELETKIVGLEAKLAPLVAKSEVDELRTGVPVALRPAEIFPKSCPMCKYRNRPDAIFCAGCGHMFVSRDEKEGTKLIARSPTEQPSIVTPMMTGPSTAELGRLSKLKSKLGSGFKSQKKVISHPPSIQSGDMLEARLTKLKSLHDSGALTEGEYEQEKRKLLGEV
jgi:DNA repair exonuclease SbcCD ATPase subunit